MRALTIRQPWAGLIVGMFDGYSPRRYEVRSWAPLMYSGRILVHAAREIDRAAMDRFGLDCKDTIRGAIIGAVSYGGCIRVADDDAWEAYRHAHLEVGQRPYGDKTFLWVFSNSVIFQGFIPCRGRLGLWTPPPAVLRRVRKVMPVD